MGILEKGVVIDVTSVSLVGTADGIGGIGVVVGLRDGRAIWLVVEVSVGRFVGDGVIVGNDVTIGASLGRVSKDIW